MTAYQEIFNSFRTKVLDYDFAQLTKEEEDSVLLSIMNVALPKFERVCTKLKDRNNELYYFNNDLEIEEIDIISELMLEVWTGQRLHNSELLRNKLSTKDFSFFSPANLLNQLRELHKDAKKNSRSMINQYSILHSNYETMR